MHSPPTAPPETDNHLPAADGIRGFACLTVLLVHALSLFWPTLSPWLRGGGKYGVWLFFVLSAFLLTLRLQQRGFDPRSLLDYALGRSLRILPLFAFACLLYFFCTNGLQTREQLLAALSFREGYIHLWTIPVEFKFYLLLPPLAWAALWLQRRYGSPALAIAALLALAAQQALWPYWQTPENSPDTRWYLPAFLFGILAALLLPQARRLPRQHLATPFALLTLLILLLALPGMRLWLLGTPPSADLMDKHLYLGLLWTLFVLLLVDGHGLAGRLLCWRPLAGLGAISYSTYLFHLLVMLPLAEHWPGQPAAFFAAVTLSIAAGSAGYHLAERPLENLRRRLMLLHKTPAAA